LFDFVVQAASSKALAISHIALWRAEKHFIKLIIKYGLAFA
jgi:hypothetical protein